MNSCFGNLGAMDIYLNFAITRLLESFNSESFPIYLKIRRTVHQEATKNEEISP